MPRSKPWAQAAPRVASVLATLVALSLAGAGCGGAVPPSAEPAPPGGEATADPPVGDGGEPMPPDGEAPAPAGPKLAERLEEPELQKALGAEYSKLLHIAQLAPKTHRALVKSHFYKAAAPCPDTKLVDVAPAPGLLVKGSVKVRAEVYEGLKQAGAVAQQRGTAVEVVSGRVDLEQAIREHNAAVIETALAVVKAASPAERSEKSLSGAAKKRMDEDSDPRNFGPSTCTTGRIGGWMVDVQLVAQAAGGGRGAVLVKAGAEGDQFTRESYEAVYWDKPKGKSFRTLTEVMAVGNFVRRCDLAYRFGSSERRDGSWRCRHSGESWEPPNRPIPAWQ